VATRAEEEACLDAAIYRSLHIYAAVRGPTTAQKGGATHRPRLYETLKNLTCEVAEKLQVSALT